MYLQSWLQNRYDPRYALYCYVRITLPDDSVTRYRTTGIGEFSFFNAWEVMTANASWCGRENKVLTRSYLFHTQHGQFMLLWVIFFICFAFWVTDFRLHQNYSSEVIKLNLKENRMKLKSKHININQHN